MKFECGYCHTEHDTIDERTKCELSCAKKRVEQEKKAKEEKLLAEKQSRINEINKKAKEYMSLTKSFMEDYKEGLTLFNGEIVPNRTIKFSNLDGIENILYKMLGW